MRAARPLRCRVVCRPLLVAAQAADARAPALAAVELAAGWPAGDGLLHSRRLCGRRCGDGVQGELLPSGGDALAAGLLRFRRAKSGGRVGSGRHQPCPPGPGGVVSDKDPKLSFGQTVAAVILVCATFALAVLAVLRLGLHRDWRLFVVAFLVSSVIGTVVHEGGHIVVALGLRRPLGEVRIGSGPVLVHFHFRGAIVRLSSWPFGGGKVWLRAGEKLGTWEGVAYRSEEHTSELQS